MSKRFSKEELHRLRNEIPVALVIKDLLEIPHKRVEGSFKFLCPRCQEFQTGINVRVNLSRCFRCKENFNTIELVMSEERLNFVSAVKMLQSFSF